MSDIVFPLNALNVAQVVAERDAEIERLRALVLDASNGLEFHGHQVDASAIRSQLYDRAQARTE